MRAYSIDSSNAMAALRVVKATWLDASGDTNDICDVEVEGISLPDAFDRIIITPTNRSVTVPVYGPYDISRRDYNLETRTTRLYGELGGRFADDIVGNRTAIAAQIPFSKANQEASGTVIDDFAPFSLWGAASGASAIGGDTLNTLITRGVHASRTLGDLRGALAEYGLTARVIKRFNASIEPGATPFFSSNIMLEPLYTLNQGESFWPARQINAVTRWGTTDIPVAISGQSLRQEVDFSTITEAYRRWDYPSIEYSNVYAAVGSSPGATLYAPRKFVTVVPSSDAQQDPEFVITGTKEPTVYIPNNQGVSAFAKQKEELARWRDENSYGYVSVGRPIPDTWESLADVALIPGQHIRLPASVWAISNVIPFLFVQSVRHEWDGGAYTQTVECGIHQRYFTRLAANAS